MSRQSWDSQMIDGVFPTKAKSVGMLDKLEDTSKIISVYEKEIWNAAIEAAASSIDTIEMKPAANHIRSLKK